MAKVRDVNTLLGMLERGRAIRDANAKFGDLMKVLHELGIEEPKKVFKGSVTIKIGVAVKDGVATIEATSEAKVPKATPGQALFFVDGDGDLSTESPRQPDMFPRKVAEEA